jgi:hypothetical protein
MRTNKNVKYFRYVDDIRLLAKSENDLRQHLITLDMLSKNIGLFPQTSKIDIHKITDINEEIKNISNPPEVVIRKADPDQNEVFRRIMELSKRYEVTNDTRFKYVLGGAKPSSKLHLRLLEILKRQPHLYIGIFQNFSKAKKLTKKVSAQSLKLLKKNTLYAAFTSNFIKALHGKIYKTYEVSLTKFCKKFYKTKNPQLKVATSQNLIDSSSLNYSQKLALIKFSNWWAKTCIVSFLREDLIGKPSYETLINKMLRDTDASDVCMVASDCCIEYGLTLHKPVKDINKLAQISLKKAGFLGKVSANDYFIRDSMVSVLGSKTKLIDWKKILGNRYKELLPKIVRWRGYVHTDPTAWVNITDTINDSLLDILFIHDGTIGKYQHGTIGGVLSTRSKFSQKYPDLFTAVKDIHTKRLESDLSHSKVRSTGKPTKYIKYKELKPLIQDLVNGYIELWRNW